MANKSGNKPNAERFNDVEFVRCELSKDQHEDLKRRLKADPAETGAMLSDLLEAGYRVTLKYDKWSSSPACFIQHTDDKHENAGKILTGRGRTALSAASEACYKHFIVFDEVWPITTFRDKPVMWDE